MQRNKNTEVFIHLSREQKRLRKESHQYFLQLKEMYDIAVSQLNDSEAQLDFIDRERLHIDYFFADPPHPDHLLCLRKSMTYDEKTWKMLIAFENPPFIWSLDITKNLADYYKLVFSSMKTDLLDFYVKEFRKTHHLKTMIERLVHITWSLSEYYQFLQNEYKKYTAETMVLYGREEHEKLCFSTSDKKRVFPELMMIREAASFLELPVQTINKMIRNAQIPFCRKEQILFFRRTELERWDRDRQAELT